MALYLTVPVDPFHTAAGASFGTFTTRQDVSPQPLPTIAGRRLQLGSKIRIMAEGEFSTTGTPTLSIGCYVGTVAGVITTVIAEYTAAATGSGAAAWPWRLDYNGVITAVGTSGSLVGGGAVLLGTSLVAFGSPLPIPSTQALRTITVDTTIDRAIGICATYGTSSGSNTIKTNVLDVLLLN